MSTAAIVVIVVVVVIVLIALLVLLPRMRATRAQHQLETHRSDAAGEHRRAAEDRAARAQVAEREAERARADARLHEARADLHDRGLADDELGDERATSRRDRPVEGGDTADRPAH